MSKKNISFFWNYLHKKVHDENLHKINKKNILEYVRDLEKLFINRNHLAINEMPYNKIESKQVLEIGCGTGAHSLLFAYYGAVLTSTDITSSRVYSCQRLINFLSDHKCSFNICDAEKLPFNDNSFDIVYSNGVLHHTDNIENAISEIFRVLKPDGEAIIMLYAKSSFMYYINIFLIKGILLGYRKKFNKNWVGASTEWMSKKKQVIFNPITNVFYKKDIKRLFSKFKIISIRKNSFIFQHIPFFGKYLSNFVGIFTGYNKAGILVYDDIWRNETKIEKIIGRYFGFCFNIKIKK